MKFGISSHINYINITEEKLLNSLLISGVELKNIYFFIGCDDIHEYMKIESSTNKFHVPHNSFDFTSLVSIIEMNLESDYWFILHDTCFVGPNFYNIIKKENYYRDCTALTFEMSMNMGIYSWDYINKRKNEILSYKNTSKNLNQFKNRLLREEDIFLKPKKDTLSKIKHKVEGPTDYYKTGTQRILEYYSDIDFYKVKSNWGFKNNYSLNI